MQTEQLFSNSICEEQIHLAERELSAFISAVAALYGPEQARISEMEWLDESELIDSPLSANRDWRAVTIEASARLANRLKVALGVEPLVPTDTKVSSIPSSNWSPSNLLV